MYHKVSAKSRVTLLYLRESPFTTKTYSHGLVIVPIRRSPHASHGVYVEGQPKIEPNLPELCLPLQFAVHVDNNIEEYTCVTAISAVSGAILLSNGCEVAGNLILIPGAFSSSALIYLGASQIEEFTECRPYLKKESPWD